MKIIKVVYDDSTDFILNTVFLFEKQAIVEYYNTGVNKEEKSARVIQTNYGTKNVPLVVFEDENQEGYAAIYSENNPDWKKEIEKHLKVV